MPLNEAARSVLLIPVHLLMILAGLLPRLGFMPVFTQSPLFHSYQSTDDQDFLPIYFTQQHIIAVATW